MTYSGVIAALADPPAGPAGSKPFHVVLVNHLYDPDNLGGAEVMVRGLAQQLQQRGIRVSVIATGRHDSSASIGGVEVRRLRIPNVFWLNDGGRRSTLAKLVWRLVNLWNPLAGRRVGEMLDDLHPDLVHTHNIASFSPIVWPAVKRRRLPLLHTAHDYYLLCPRWSLSGPHGTACTRPSLLCRVYRRWHLRQAANLDTFCSPSKFLLAQHAGLLGASVDAITLPNGIPLAPNVQRPTGSIATAPLRFLMLGQLLPSKGIAVALAAMREIPTDRAMELHVAGSGPMEGDVRVAAMADPRIVYHGFVSGAAKHALIAASQILLYPSLWYENGPYALMEAAAAGLAVLGTDIGAIPEFVADGVNGHLFPAGDAGALGRHMVALLDAPAHVLALRRGALARAPLYDEDLMVSAYLREYARLAPDAAAMAGRPFVTSTPNPA